MKKITKISAILLAMAMLFCLCACEKESDPEEPAKTNATIDELLSEGFEQHSGIYYADTKLLAVEYVAADFSDIIVVKCTIEEDKADEFFAIMPGDDYQKSCSQFLADYEVSTVSLKEHFPPQSDFDAFVGEPIQALVDAGYEQSGAGNDEDGILFFEYADWNYEIRVYTEKEFKAAFDLEGYDLNTLVIKSVTFCDFGSWENYL